MAFTDHNVIVPHNDLTDEKFLALTSCEMNIHDSSDNKGKQFRRTYHLNFYSKDKNKTVSAVFNDSTVGNSWKSVTDEMRKNKYDAKYSVESINELIRLMKEDGFLVTYNHPVWSLQNYSDYIGLKGLWGVEVYNTDCYKNGLKDTDTPYIDLLRQNARIIPIAADDTHNERGLFGGFCMIEAGKLDYDQIISAMENGKIYSSTGPLIKEMTIEDGILTIKCDAVRSITLNTERRWTKSVNGENLTTAQFDLKAYFETNAEYKPENTFIRITIED